MKMMMTMMMTVLIGVAAVMMKRLQVTVILVVKEVQCNSKLACSLRSKSV